MTCTTCGRRTGHFDGCPASNLGPADGATFWESVEMDVITLGSLPSPSVPPFGAVQPAPPPPKFPADTPQAKALGHAITVMRGAVG